MFRRLQYQLTSSPSRKVILKAYQGKEAALAELRAVGGLGELDGTEIQDAIWRSTDTASRLYERLQRPVVKDWLAAAILPINGGLTGIFFFDGYPVLGAVQVGVTAFNAWTAFGELPTRIPMMEALEHAEACHAVLEEMKPKPLV